ncbi:MAG: hypothetical protein IJ570_04155 [Prevotella sp.]|nr:hypothetical protein [Prevotella sp.]
MKKLLLLFALMLAVPLGVLAQGSTWQTATIINNGSSGSGTLDKNHEEMWFKVVVPEDGHMRFTFSTSDNLKLAYIDCCWSNGETYYTRKSTGWYPEDGTALEVPDAGPGTYYLKVARSSGAGTATLNYQFTANSYGNDKADNDEWNLGSEIALGQTVQGHLGYRDGTDYIDDVDWYKIVVPKDGQVDLVFNCNQTYELKPAYVDFCWSNGETYYTRQSTGWYPDPSGTLTIPDVGPGTYYIHVARSSGHGGYTLTYNFTASSYSNDPADNDEWNKGSEIALGQTVQGHLGYRDASNYIDDVDWYTIQVPQDGQVDLVFDCERKYDLKLAYVEFCCSNGETYYTRKGTGWYPNQSDTLTIPDVGPGTYYIHVARSSGHGGYTLRYNFTASSYGNDPADNDEWNKGSEIASGQTVQGHLGYRDGSNYIDDVDWYTIQVPQDGQVDLVFDCERKYDLKLAYVEFCWSNGETYYTRQSTGWYPNQSDTLTIDNVGVGTYYIHVRRSEGHGGYKLKYIFTPNNYRNDTEPNDELEQATQTLGNNETLTAHLGYRDANNKVDDYDWFRLDIDNRAAMLALNVESDTLSTLKLAYVDIIRRKGDSQSTVASTGWYPTTPITLNLTEVEEDADYYVKVVRSEGNGGYSLTYGALERMETSMVRVSFTGQNSVRLGIPCEYTIKVENIDNHHSGKWFLLVNATDDIKLLGAKLPCNGGVEELPMDSITYEGDQSMVFVVPSMAPYESYTFNILAEGLVIKEAPALNSQVEFDTNSNGHGPNRFIISGTTALCVVGLVTLDYAGDKVTEFMTDVINEHIDLDEKELAYYRTRVNDKVDQSLATYKKETGEGVVVAKRAVKTVATKWIETLPGGGLINFFGELIETTKTFSGAITRRWLYWTQRDLDPNYKEWEKKYDAKMLDAKMGCNRIVRSWDPNEMVGPVGYGDDNYIAETHTVDYRILFENKKEATAPAYRIRITDVLDENVFDVSSVRFGQTSHEGDAYNWKMSREGNKVSWDIEGIELPPNVNAPEGEGYVTFTVDLLPGLKSGTQLKNKATIIFDYNEPIETNEYVNTLDLTAPTGQVMASGVSGSNMVLSLEGLDTESGVSHYLVYSSTADGQDFQFCGQSMKGSITIPVEAGHNAADYTFAVVAVDNVGNAQLTLSEPWSMAAGISTPVADTQAWTIATLGGTVVASGNQGAPSARLVPGVYVVRQGSQSRKIIVK